MKYVKQACMMLALSVGIAAPLSASTSSKIVLAKQWALKPENAAKLILSGCCVTVAAITVAFSGAKTAGETAEVLAAQIVQGLNDRCLYC